MSEGFKIVVLILGLMTFFGEFHFFPEATLFPRGTYAIIAFYIIMVWIDERVIPIIKEIDDLFDKG